MRSLEQLDRWIAGKVKQFAGTSQRPEVLEVRRDVLEDVRSHIEAKGGGKFVFPYGGLAVEIAAQDEEEAERLAATLGGPEGLTEDVRELLQHAGTAVPVDFAVTVATTVGEGAAPWAVRYLRRESTAPAKAAESTPKTRPAAKLTVLNGEADVTELEVTTNRVNLGRLKEIFGERDGLRRRNDIAFADVERTVSREHAYLQYDTSSGRFRICDYQSTRGTAVFRDGRRFEVPRSSPRGLPLRSGDEIHLGKARLRFEQAAE